MNSSMPIIRSIQKNDLEKIQEFTDFEIGQGYYSNSEIKSIFERSLKQGVMCSFLLVEGESICGIRFSFPHGNWQHGKGQALATHLWPHPIQETAYFQSLFLSSKFQGDGWGGKLSQESLKALKKIGARGVVCHSWKESPNNSSTRYLQKLGFRHICEHPLYWKDVPYNCTRCHKPPCQCTAIEMYLDLEKINNKELL